MTKMKFEVHQTSELKALGYRSSEIYFNPSMNAKLGGFQRFFSFLPYKMFRTNGI
mgnify:CR=1 FL=1